MEFWNERWAQFLTLKSLRPKLLLIVALALGPLALASIGQGLLRFQTRHEEIDSHILQTAMYATGNERSILSGVEQYLGELAQHPDIRNAGPTCAQTLSDTLIGRSLLLDVVVINADGKMVCGASSALLTNSYTHFPWWPSVKAGKSVVLGVAYSSALTHHSMLPVTLPLHNAAGAFAGAISTSVDLAWLNHRMEFSQLPPGALLMILRRDGTVIASNRPAPKRLAEQVAARDWNHPQGILSINSGGQTWQWAAQPVANGDMIVAFGASEPGLFDMTRVYFLADILLPLLMIALASVAIWLGTEWLVIRWTTYLQRVSAAYAQNHFSLELSELDAAPEEFRQLGLEMKNMAGFIRDRDRRLNRAIVQETAMASEIHHRVKNNLQIVSSLISLYSQRIFDPQSRVAFRQIVVRVDALTLVHRLIEKNDTMPVVDMKALLTEMADQMRASAAENDQRYSLTLSVEACSLPAATATPIALFAAEALSFGMFDCSSDSDPRDVRLEFAKDGPAHLLLTIEDSSFTADELRAGVPSPQRFLGAFADQLQGKYILETMNGGGCKLSLRVPFEIAVAGAYTDYDDCADGPAVFQFRAGNANTESAPADQETSPVSAI